MTTSQILLVFHDLAALRSAGQVFCRNVLLFGFAGCFSHGQRAYGWWSYLPSLCSFYPSQSGLWGWATLMATLMGVAVLGHPEKQGWEGEDAIIPRTKAATEGQRGTVQYHSTELRLAHIIWFSLIPHVLVVKFIWDFHLRNGSSVTVLINPLTPGNQY